MAKQLQPLSVVAPGFFGLNTQDSPVGMSANFAKIADNCVIDKRGRIAARQGHSQVSTNTGSLGSNTIEALHEHIAYDGTKTVYSAGNNLLYTGTTTLTTLAFPVGYQTVSANNWKIVSFNNNVYFFQRGYAPLKQTGGTGALTVLAHGGAGAPQTNEAMGAFGRLWTADETNDKYTLHFSDLLGDDFHVAGGSSAGTLDLTTVWRSDEIVALADWNGLLVIFGKRQTVLYSGAESPAVTLALEDIIDVGCIARDSVQQTADDLIFLSDRGVMSLGRLIQEKSQPLRDISKNVRTDLMAVVPADTSGVKSVYSPEHAFYLLSFPAVNEIYVFDLRAPLEDGSYRATKWTGIALTAFERLSDGSLYMGKDTLGIVEYGGYQDAGSAYRMRYYSNEQDFGAPANEKFLKKMRITVIGGSSATAILKWGYDYEESYAEEVFQFGSSSIAQFNISEFNTTAEYNAGITINNPSVNASGSGTTITFGVETDIDGGNFSIQKIDILALIGRLL